MFIGTDKTFAWKSKGFSQKNFKTPVSSGKSFVPKLTFNHNWRIGVKIKGNCLIQHHISSTHEILRNVFPVYELRSCAKNIGKTAQVKKNV